MNKKSANTATVTRGFTQILGLEEEEINFRAMNVSLSESLRMGQNPSDDVQGAQLRSVAEVEFGPGYRHMPDEDKLYLADMMIERWMRFRRMVIEEAQGI